MSTTISQRELRNDTGAIMRRVESGETFTVTRNGTPIADLVPHREDGGVVAPQTFVPMDVVAAALGGAPDWGVESFRSEQQELDRAVDDDNRDPWERG